MKRRIWLSLAFLMLNLVALVVSLLAAADPDRLAAQDFCHADGSCSAYAGLEFVSYTLSQVGAPVAEGDCLTYHVPQGANGDHATFTVVNTAGATVTGATAGPIRVCGNLFQYPTVLGAGP